MSTVRLIVNPVASSVTDRTRAEVREALAGHDVDEVVTRARDHATDLARQAVADGVDAVVVFGGDGTLNEAANGLLAAGGGSAFGALPGGSTNVFARTVGLPRKPAPAAEVVSDALRRGSVRHLPVGRANGRAFLFHVGVGYDAAVVRQVERRNALKRTVGQAIFVYAAFATWFRHYDHSRPQFRVACGDGPAVDGSFTICLNTNPYTYFGPRALNVAPGASGEQGLAAVTLRSLTVRSLLGVFARALGSGAAVGRHPQVTVCRDQPRIVVTGYRPIPWQVDGDYLGTTEELELTSQADRLPVLVTRPAPNPT